MSNIVNRNSSRIKIRLDRNPYEVVIGPQILNSIGEELIYLGIKKGTKILVTSNQDVAKPYADVFIKSLLKSGFEAKLLVIKAGEDQKNLDSIALIHNAAYENRLERGSLMIALGGGVIGDMTGFAAATWLRGLSFIQVPTTLLAMVDASVGGKTGVNHPKGKNLIGSFHQPKLVLIDPNTLNSLPEREFRAGMAEVIKYGVIGDKSLFSSLEKIPSLRSLECIGQKSLLEIIQRSVQAKAKIIEQDEHEGGIRAVLNYGHTFGHVVENLCGYGQWLHGEAVAIGMVAVGALALKRDLWSMNDFERQRKLLAKAGLPIKWPSIDIDNAINTLKGDKKVKDGQICFVLPKEIGKVEIFNDVSISEIKECLLKINQELFT